MEFEADDVDFSVAEFYETYKFRLPKIVKVTQGFLGDIIDDIFDRDGVCHLNLICPWI